MLPKFVVQSEIAPERQVDSRAPRIPRMVTVYTHSRSGMRKIIIYNISETGFAAFSVPPPLVGEYFDVDLLGIGRVMTLVKWTDGVRFGARFLVKVNPKALRASPPDNSA